MAPDAIQSTSIRMPTRQALLAPAFLTLLWFLFLRHALDGTSSFAVFMDNEFFIGPVLSAMSESLRAGEWPLRFDTALGGLPLYNFTQLTPFYPLYLLPLPVFETVQETIHSMHMLIVMHLLIMEITTYVFLRVLGASRVAAVTGAALIAFSANSFSYAIWLNIVAPYAWFPLFLAGLLGLAQGKPWRAYAPMTWVGIVMLTLASPAQPLIHALMTAGVFGLFFLGHSLAQRDYGVFTRFFLPTIGLACLCGLVLALVLLPQLRSFPNMIRWIGAFPAVYGNTPIPFAAFEAEQLARVDLAGVLFKFRGGAVGQQFVGLIVFALALLKIFSRQRNWMVNALIFIAAYALVASFGSNFGLGYVNYWIPLVNKIREPSRFLFLFQFAICALAALALDDLRQSAEKGADNSTGYRLITRQWVAMATLLGAAIAIPLVFHDRIVSAIPPLVSVLVLAVLLAGSWLAPRIPFAAKGLVLALSWSVATLGTLAVEVTWLPPSITQSQYATDGLAALDAALARIVELDPTHDYRVIFNGSIDAQTASMLASFRGVRTLNAYFNPAPRQQFEELYYHGPRTDNYARVQGAKFMLCKACPAEAVQGYSYSESIAGYDLYTTADALPHSYVATSVSGDFSNLGEFAVKAATLPLDASFLFVETVQRLLLPLPDSAGAETPACTSREEHRGAINVSLHVACERQGVLVLNKFHDVNWRVRIDGSRTRLLRVNGNQMGVQVPTGTHLVEFRFRPRIMSLLLVVSALALLLSLGLFFWRGAARLWTQKDHTFR